MAINRLASYTPPANVNTVFHTSERNAVVSILATNKSALQDASIRVWVKPNSSNDEKDFSFIAYDVTIPALNSLETFKFAINTLDIVYIRSSTASVSFTLNGIYESNGISNISVGTVYPTGPQVGDVFVDTLNNNVLYWTGTNWYNGIADTSLYPFPVYSASAPSNPIVGQLWIDSDSTTFEITNDRLVPISSASTNGMYLVNDGSYPFWQTLEKELPSYSTSSASYLKTSNDGESLLWTTDVAPLSYPQFIGYATASTVSLGDASNKLATTEWVSNKGYLTSSAALSWALPAYDPVVYNTFTLANIRDGYLYSNPISGSVSAINPTITIGTSVFNLNSSSASLTGLTSIGVTSITGLTSATYTDTVTTTGKQILYTGYWNGVESNTYYWRSAGNIFRWYLAVTPDAGTSDKMELNSTGLVVSGTTTTTSLTPNAGTTSVAPIRLTSGTNLTAVQSGAFEYDGKTVYLTKDGSAVAGRSSIDTSIITSTTTNFTLSDINTVQNIFPAANDTLTNLAASTTYLMEGIIYISTTGTNSNSIQLGLGGTATYTSIGYNVFVTENATDFSTVIPTATYSSLITAASAVAVTSNVATATYRTIRINGILRVNAAGTFIPQITFTAAPGAAPIVAANSYLRLNAIGSNTVASIGAWG